MQPNAYLPTASITVLATSNECGGVQSAANTLLDGSEKPVGICMHCALDQVSAASASAAPITSLIMRSLSSPFDPACKITNASRADCFI